MVVKRFTIGELWTNCYVVSNEETKECFIVDPPVCEESVLSYLEAQGLELKAIFLTHGHYDHIMGVDGYLEKFSVPVYAHEDEQEVLKDGAKNLSAKFGAAYEFHGAESVKDGQTLEIAGFKVKVLHTPGHTCGSCSYYIEKEEALFCGDTVFYRSIGRTDFPTSNHAQLIKSAKEKIMTLPKDVKLYPGHMEETSVKHETWYNTFLY
ncbi:MAG: MBL fold metallo-hydrolase [Schaedlerella sp.]|nr:MBL fold metallo-hydrolase [Schaedlerella sp.]